MSFYYLLFLTASLLVQPIIAVTNTDASNSTTPVIPMNDNNPNCTCYVVESANSTANDTSSPSYKANLSYFLYHRFYDFRDLPLSRAAFNTAAWDLDWAIQTWTANASDASPYKRQNLASNVYMASDNDTSTTSSSSSSAITADNYLVLRTARVDKETQSCGEIENEQENLLHASIRFRVRVIGGKGAIAGLFTYYNDTSESDIEIRTSDEDTEYRFANQPTTINDEMVDGASRDITDLPDWNDWHTLRLDWLPTVCRWYVDDEFIVENTYSVPKEPSKLILNMWSNGGVWSGNMSIGDSAQLHVKWVQVVFNTSGPREGPNPDDVLDRRSVNLFDVRDGLERRDEAAKHRLSKRAAAAKKCTYICVIDDVVTTGYPQLKRSMASSNVSGMGAWSLSTLVVVFSILWWS